ncbi:MAG: ribosome silencing factor [Betaproteobacteria bacterium]
MQSEEIKQIAEEALEEIKARDIVVLDTSSLTSLFDYMIVASAESARQTKALAGNVHDKVKLAGGTVIGVEGEQTGEWVLVDLGGVIVHIMQPAIRDYYNLEQLWGGDGSRRLTQLRRAAEVRTNDTDTAHL